MYKETAGEIEGVG